MLQPVHEKLSVTHVAVVKKGIVLVAPDLTQGKWNFVL
jgi:hypothetical protein